MPKEATIAMAPESELGADVLVHETDGKTVWVLCVVHAARRWPPD